MNHLSDIDPIIPPLHSEPGLKDYHCPHCDKFLFRGNVKKLNMVCQHCQKLVRAGESELIKRTAAENIPPEDIPDADA